MAQTAVARCKFEEALARRLAFDAGVLDDRAQYFAIAFRRDRQAMLEVPGREAAFALLIAKLDFTHFQCFAIGRAENGKQHAAACPVRQLFPIDVERCRVRRGWPPFEYVEPPWIVSEMHANMVRYEIEDQPEIVLFQPLAESLKPGPTTKFRVEFGVVDDVVAVRASLARFEEGRCIDMRD